MLPGVFVLELMAPHTPNNSLFKPLYLSKPKKRRLPTKEFAMQIDNNQAMLHPCTLHPNPTLVCTLVWVRSRWVVHRGSLGDTPPDSGGSGARVAQRFTMV